ncbi:hypothetical protein ABZ990_19930 [Streptomyces sp. NPDC046203]
MEEACQPAAVTRALRVAIHGLADTSPTPRRQRSAGVDHTIE